MVNIKTKFPRGIEAGLSVEVSEASSEISLTSNCLESDQVISKSTYDGESERAPGPGLQLSWSMHALTNRSHRLQATSFKQQAPSSKLDMKDIMGYSIIKKNETRTYAQLNASRPRTVVTRRNNCSRNCSALEATDPGHKLLEPSWKQTVHSIRTQTLKLQATSFKPQAASIKLQAASDKLPDSMSFIKFQAASIKGLD